MLYQSLNKSWRFLFRIDFSHFLDLSDKVVNKKFEITSQFLILLDFDTGRRLFLIDFYGFNTFV